MFVLFDEHFAFIYYIYLHSKHTFARRRKFETLFGEVKMTNSSWSVGICSFGDGLGTCCLTLCFPCVTFGRIAEVVDDGQSSCTAACCIYALLMSIQCQWLYSCTYRKKLRSRYGLASEPCNDCCVHFCCEPCALCQEHAELKNRGLDPSKGYTGRPTAAPTQPAMFK
ncbi:cell number regulator 7-like [Dendrobium catenatum]|uniref:Cell number regulator 10 n=1 Tax=Dendrobium catenatum TaxID=906689 RepID=A0A2I0VGU7_9ASPA|nr:cell number regulator 7-like [Dendrobium catenatum]PKU62642.1 Cell number regulator 10 [Dendrobium catenatum]